MVDRVKTASLNRRVALLVAATVVGGVLLLGIYEAAITWLRPAYWGPIIAVMVVSLVGGLLATLGFVVFAESPERPSVAFMGIASTLLPVLSLALMGVGHSTWLDVSSGRGPGVNAAVDSLAGLIGEGLLPVSALFVVQSLLLYLCHKANTGTFIHRFLGALGWTFLPAGILVAIVYFSLGGPQYLAARNGLLAALISGSAGAIIVTWTVELQRRH